MAISFSQGTHTRQATKPPLKQSRCTKAKTKPQSASADLAKLKLRLEVVANAPTRTIRKTISFSQGTQYRQAKRARLKQSRGTNWLETRKWHLNGLQRS
jgi:hypothetical protein